MENIGSCKNCMYLKPKEEHNISIGGTQLVTPAQCTYNPLWVAIHNPDTHYCHLCEWKI
jgi:hypothetical protein